MASFAVVEYSSVAEAEHTVVAMESSQCMLQMRFCVPGETAADTFSRLLAAKVYTLFVIHFTLCFISVAEKKGTQPCSV